MDILQLLEKKYNLFSDYLFITQKMYNNDLYENENYFDERGELAAKIDALEVNIKKIMAKDILSYDRAKLSDEEQQVFDAALKIRSVVSRISELNDVMKSKMDKEIEGLRGEIAKENTGNSAAVSKYSGVYSTGDDYSSTRTV